MEKQHRGAAWSAWTANHLAVHVSAVNDGAEACRAFGYVFVILVS